MRGAIWGAVWGPVWGPVWARCGSGLGDPYGAISARRGTAPTPTRRPATSSSAARATTRSRGRAPARPGRCRRRGARPRERKRRPQRRRRARLANPDRRRDHLGQRLVRQGREVGRVDAEVRRQRREYRRRSRGHVLVEDHEQLLAREHRPPSLEAAGVVTTTPRRRGAEEVEEPRVARLVDLHAAPGERHQRGRPRPLDRVPQGDEEPQPWEAGVDRPYRPLGQQRVARRDLASPHRSPVGRKPRDGLELLHPPIRSGRVDAVPVMSFLPGGKRHLRVPRQLAVKPGRAALLDADAEEVDRVHGSIRGYRVAGTISP